MDLKLPGLSGFDVARQAARPASDTAHPADRGDGLLASRPDEARKIGFDAVILKPCDPALLVAEIRRLLPSVSPAES
jgi:DNA-binding response OmpR family regulator